MGKVGRKMISNRDEVRKNTVCVPMMKHEKERIEKEANRLGMSNSAFMRMLAAKYFEG